MRLYKTFLCFERMKFHLPLATRHSLLAIVLCLVSNVSPAQSWVWAKGEGDIGNDAANAVAVDVSGNTYVTGNIAGKANFSGTVYQGNGIYEAYIAKYDPAGNLLWVKLAGGKGNDLGSSIKWDKGFLYLCGTFEDTAFFENTALVTKGQIDAFIAKYDDSGNLIWVRSAGGTGYDNATGITVDNGGNIYIAGNYENSITLGSLNLSSSNLYHESFYAKYDGGGNVVWAKSVTGNNANLITGIAYNYHSGVFLTGYFGGNLKIGVATVNSISPSYDVFLAKVQTGDGSADWLKRAGGTYEDGANGVCSDKEGYPSITGYFAGTAYFNNNSVTYSDYNDVFVARYDTAGNNMWVRAGKGLQLDLGCAITADDNGNIFSTGMFQVFIDFDGHTLNAIDRDVFLISFDKNGNTRWVAKAGGMDTECGFGIAVHTNGNVSVCGYYLHTCFFGSIQIDYANGNDLFVAKYNAPVVNAVEEVKDDLTVSVYPNPCNSDCGIRIADLTATTTYSVYNSLGETLGSGLLTANSQLPTANWLPGIYFIEVTAAQKTKTLKLIKQ